MTEYTELRVGMPVRATEKYISQLRPLKVRARDRGTIKRLSHGFVKVQWDGIVRPEELHPDFIEPVADGESA